MRVHIARGTIENKFAKFSDVKDGSNVNVSSFSGFLSCGLLLEAELLCFSLGICIFKNSGAVATVTETPVKCSYFTKVFNFVELSLTF